MPDNSERLKKAREYAFLLLKFRPRSISEFREKLARRNFSQEIIDELVSDFVKRGLLDDAKFTKLWIEDRQHLKPAGKLKLKAELAAKGIAQADIDEAIRVLTPEAGEYGSALNLAKKRVGRLGNLDKQTIKRRLYGYLERRGFSYDVIGRAVREASRKE